MFGYGLYCCGDVGGIVDVELDCFDWQVFGLQFECFGYGDVVFVFGQQCVYVGLGQLMDGFQIDVVGGIGDQGDLLGSGIYVNNFVGQGINGGEWVCCGLLVCCCCCG